MMPVIHLRRFILDKEINEYIETLKASERKKIPKEGIFEVLPNSIINNSYLFDN